MSFVSCNHMRDTCKPESGAKSLLKHAALLHDLDMPLHPLWCLLQARHAQQLKQPVSKRLSCRATPSPKPEMEKSYLDTDVGATLSDSYDKDLSRPPKNRRAGVEKTNL